MNNVRAKLAIVQNDPIVQEARTLYLEGFYEHAREEQGALWDNDPAEVPDYKVVWVTKALEAKTPVGAWKAITKQTNDELVVTLDEVIHHVGRCKALLDSVAVSTLKVETINTIAMGYTAMAEIVQEIQKRGMPVEIISRLRAI